ncbi:hypothetical protein [Winogradskyella sp.]|nr:hypothetical protein [Winogradskyella sp.]
MIYLISGTSRQGKTSVLKALSEELKVPRLSIVGIHCKKEKIEKFYIKKL